MTRYAIGLGSNLGDRLQHLIDAHDELARNYQVVGVSALYETVPVGGPDQDPYLNAVIVVETDACPTQVLETCQEIELRHGRERRVRWGPRTLDLDIVTADVEHHDERLSIPHPRVAEREFVLRPLNDLWPDAPLGKDVSAARAIAGVEPQGVDRLGPDWVPPVARWKARALVAGQFALILGIAGGLAYDGSLPEGEVTLIRVLGAVLAFVGVILAFIASRRLGVATASPVPRPGARLVTSGPYRLVRHPIYGGLSLFMMGTALVLDSLVGFVVAAGLVPYFLLKARYEENQLRMRFPDYQAYRRAVPRRLIPFVV